MPPRRRYWRYCGLAALATMTAPALPVLWTSAPAGPAAADLSGALMIVGAALAVVFAARATFSGFTRTGAKQPGRRRDG